MSVWLSEEQFSAACAALPLVSVDLMLTRVGTQGPELLLGLRNNRPAQDTWFTPGGRIRKGEPLDTAMQRIAQEEVGLGPQCLARAQLMGAWDHFYADNAFDPKISTHYVNLPYSLPLDAYEADALCLPTGDCAQHRAWQWMPVAQAAQSELVHPYVRAELGRLLELL